MSKRDLRHSLLHIEGSIPARLNQYGEMPEMATLDFLSRTRPQQESQSNGFVSHEIVQSRVPRVAFVRNMFSEVEASYVRNLMSEGPWNIAE